MVATTGKTRLSPRRKQWLRTRQLERGNSLTRLRYSAKKSYPRQDYENKALRRMGTQTPFKNVIDRHPMVGTLSRKAYLLTASKARSNLNKIRRKLDLERNAADWERRFTRHLDTQNERGPLFREPWEGQGMYRRTYDKKLISVVQNPWKEEDLVLYWDTFLKKEDKISKIRQARIGKWEIFFANKDANPNLHGTAPKNGWRPIPYNDAEFAVNSVIGGGQIRIKIPGQYTLHFTF